MDFEKARKHMIDSQVRPNDVTSLELQMRMENLPREQFLPAALRGQAYVERELEVSPGRFMLTMRDFSKLAAAADIQSDDLVLDVACGAGYSTAVLAGLAEMVVAVESDEKIAGLAQDHLSELGIDNAAVVVGDPAQGVAGQGPFDIIFIGAAVELVPEELLAQLKEGGRLAVILREDGVSRGIIYTNKSGAFSRTEKFNGSAAHTLSGFEKKKAFVF